MAGRVYKYFVVEMFGYNSVHGICSSWHDELSQHNEKMTKNETARGRAAERCTRTWMLCS
jgi:hypothetical protein